MNRNLVNHFVGADMAEKEPDYSGLLKIDLKDKTIESRIIRTDNPDPQSWLKMFLRKNEMQNQ